MNQINITNMKWKQTNAHPYSDNVITWENLEQAFKGLIKL